MVGLPSGPPRFVVFEGVDGAGKSAFAAALSAYYRRWYPEMPLYAGTFPGSDPGTLGELVYRIHHGTLELPSQPFDIQVSLPALQLLHVAAHVDLILHAIQPMFASGGSVILDRYWWSTYAHIRQAVGPDVAWGVIGAERPFWSECPEAHIIYLRRAVSLKPAELDASKHRELEAYYAEVISAEQARGASISVINNETTMDAAWRTIVNSLGLKYHQLAS